MKNNSHVKRVFTVLILMLVTGFIAQRFFQPKSFGELGHFRADAIGEIMSLELVHQGREICNECHAEIYDLHKKDIHFAVQCEDCHGPGDKHVKYHKEADTSISVDQAAMPKNYTHEGCLFCHRKLSARPSTFAQVDPDEHYKFLHVTDNETNCISCHSPHEPLFLLEEVSNARVHPVIFECEDCHNTPPEKSHNDVPDHPVIFECNNCHPAIAADSKTHTHSFLRCTACHLFYRLDETSGRIFKNGNRRFCLLCHEHKPFKNQEELPQIVYSDHLQVMTKHIRNDLEAVGDKPAACLVCHKNENTIPKTPYPEHLAEMKKLMSAELEVLIENPTVCLICHHDSFHDSILVKRLRQEQTP